ncbi:adenosylcobinamide-phosphate synthase CbiB [Alkalihalobacillus sp. CinArs1]|uniref:adenosylcobinamide-phosphate synthase CbiB n=1 Tax=Alkalihalobacillus sp. CinArs1 TaxID=2995314 RepID=UPI0022DD2288|nr:adenosylcobinamide-phosphate synthase CbiB [Alkalihalobacillus sp. CinArs1]
MILNHLIALSIAFCLDLILGDPPKLPHPVRWIGSTIEILDHRLNNGSYRKLKGVVMILTVLMVVVGITVACVLLAYSLSPLLGIALEALLIATTISQKSLRTAALEVFEPLQKGEKMEARRMLSYIVGRDTDQLGESEIARGAVETVAENTSDGVTAPLFWALFGGAAGAVAYRVVNTCDSMVGYQDDKYYDFGWASAKLDDVVNWLPSRMTAFCMLLSTKPKQQTMKGTWTILFRDAKKHPSPNSGWGEAATAALLGVQLGGINSYRGQASNRARMGDPIVPLHSLHIPQSISIMHRTSLLFLIILWIGGLIFDATFPWF